MTETTKRNIWDRVKSTIIVIGAVFTMFGLFFGAWQYIDTTYARDVQVIFLNHKIDVKILDDRINKLQVREWELQDRLATLKLGDPDHRQINQQLRRTKAEKTRLNDELQVVISKYKQAEENIKH